MVECGVKKYLGGVTMIYIMVSNLYEAKPFIKHCGLIKDESQDKLEVYYSPSTMLVITRGGAITSAISISYFLAQRRPSTSDIVINLTLCETSDRNIPLGSLYLGYKIIEWETNKRFYPDLIFGHPFEEEEICSTSLPCALIQKDDDKIIFPAKLLDMEAATVMQTLMALFKTRHIYIFRIVAGYGESDKKTPILTERLVAQQVVSIMDYIYDLQRKCLLEYDLTDDEIRLVKRFCIFFVLPPFKEQELFETIYFYKSEQHSMMGVMQEFMETYKKEEIFTRAQGIHYYHEFCKLMEKEHKEKLSPAAEN